MIMYRTKNTSIVLFMMSITFLLCTSCGGRNVGESTEEPDEENYQDTDNPLNIIGMKPKYEKVEYEMGVYYDFLCVTVQTTNGDLKYSDEDAELYYDDYAAIFTWAEIICRKAKDNDNLREYFKKNLLEVVCNLPLDNSYPEDVREYANKAYYDYKDGILNTLYLNDRGYGYKEYAFCKKGYTIKMHIRKDENGILYIN